ncbi:MAG: TIGR03619 family F420-dependent LLM class oxidoreductase [Dehalococcoidia bacterium]
MKIGITVRNLGGFGAEAGGIHACLDIARSAEALGYDSVWVADHVILPVEATARYPYNESGRISATYRDAVYDPLVLISALAQATERVEIGVAVLVIPYRHPLMTAKMLATADQLSGGRVILGAGVGWLEDEFTALGLPPEHFAHRGSVTNDYLRAMKEAWLNTGPSWYQGRYVRFTDAGTFPHPVRQPHIPIWAGGKGEQVLIRAARLGNGYIAIASDPATLREEVEQLRRFAEADRRDPSELTVAMTGAITVTASPAGTDRAPLTGTPQQIVEGLNQYVEAGLQHLVATIRAVGDTSLEATRTAMEQVAREVRPALVEEGVR